MPPSGGTRGGWFRSQHGGEAYEDRGSDRGEVATRQGRQALPAPRKREEVASTAPSPEPAEEHGPAGLPELELQPQGCETVKFLLIRNTLQGSLAGSVVTNPLARAGGSGLIPDPGRLHRLQSNSACTPQQESLSSEPGGQLPSPQAAATEGCAPEPALSHRRSLRSEKPARRRSRAAPFSATREGPGAARKPGAAVDTYRHLYKTKRALTDGERARQKRGRRRSGPTPERASGLTAPSSLPRPRGGPQCGKLTQAFRKLFGSRVAPGPPSKGGSLRLPSPLLRPSLDPGALRLEEEMGLGGRREALLCSDRQVFVLFSSCSWACLDGLTEPQKLRASKAPPSGGSFS